MAYVSIEKTKILPFNFQLEEVHEILEKKKKFSFLLMSFVFINRSHYMDLRRAFNFLFQVLPNVSRYDPRTENNELITPRKPIFHSTCHSFYPNYKQDYYSVLFDFDNVLISFSRALKLCIW